MSQRINLIELYKGSNIKKRFEKFRANNEHITDESKEHNLKTGDIIEIKGHDENTIFVTEILGFYNDDQCYILNDVIWFTVKLSVQLVRKL